MYGRPITKKNSPRIVKYGGFPKVIPSKAFCTYQDDCLIQLAKCTEKYEGKVHVICRYWLPDRKWFPDFVNLLSASHDILEKAGILDNDKNIVSVDGSKIVGFSKNNPRAEITIIPVEHEFEVEE